MKQLWFQTTRFSPVDGEEERTNPGRFGQALAYWVREQLIERGHEIEEEPIPEDWGWVVIVHRKPFMLWVGCGNEDGSLSKWSVFVEAECGLIQKLLSRVDPAPNVLALEQELEAIVGHGGFEAVEWEGE